MTIDANTFQSAEWAKQKNLYTQVFDSVEELDEAILQLADYLLSKNPEAQSLLKKVFWENCVHWDTLLEERAEMSGKLVLSEFTREALAGYSI